MQGLGKAGVLRLLLLCLGVISPAATGCARSHDGVPRVRDASVDGAPTSRDAGPRPDAPDTRDAGRDAGSAPPTRRVDPERVICGIRPDEILDLALRVSACGEGQQSVESLLAQYYSMGTQDWYWQERTLSGPNLYFFDCEFSRCVLEGLGSSGCGGYLRCIREHVSDEGCDAREDFERCAGGRIERCTPDVAGEGRDRWATVRDCADRVSDCVEVPTAEDPIYTCGGMQCGNRSRVNTCTDTQTLVGCFSGSQRRAPINCAPFGGFCRQVNLLGDVENAACGRSRTPDCSEFDDEAPRCEGDSVAICNGGLTTTVDCRDRGYSGCEEGRCVF